MQSFFSSFFSVSRFRPGVLAPDGGVPGGLPGFGELLVVGRLQRLVGGLDLVVRLELPVHQGGGVA